MAVTVVWDTWLKAGAETEGLRLTRQVWSDMRAFEGYVSHDLLIDQDAPGHIIALGRWRSRDDADKVRERYRDSETIRQLTPLLARPRERWITDRGSAGLRLHSPRGRSPHRGVTHLPPRIVFSTGSNASACRKKPRSVGCELSTVPSLSSPRSFSAER